MLIRKEVNKMFELEKKAKVVLSSNNGCGKCTASAGCKPSDTSDQNGKIKSATSSNKSIPNKQC